MKVGARSSPLSKAQVEEIAKQFQLEVDPVWIETMGDLDKTTSLRTLGKSDFFTRELDAMLLKGEIDVAIHSAKDLPDPIPKGLKIFAITKSIDPRDALVFRKQPLKVVATSSERREKAVQSLFPAAQFVDLRGTIAERLEKLEKGEVDGVVIAEAALIRLKLTHLHRIYLPGETTPLQGCLAIVGREGDPRWEKCFISASIQ